MRRQGLVVPLPSVESAVSGMAGAHAQVISAAELWVGVRATTVTPSDIRPALRQGGSVVKTYGPRGTVHLLPRVELPLWCAALCAVPYGSPLAEGVRLDADHLTAIVAAIADSLATADSLNGDELGDAVVERLGT